MNFSNVIGKLILLFLSSFKLTLDRFYTWNLVQHAAQIKIYTWNNHSCTALKFKILS